MGLLKCYDVDGKSWMEWTRDDLRVYAVTSRSDLKRRVLFKAWNSAGPVGPVTSAAGTSTSE